jgi:GNAT superfamily N-acetyltransferase
MPDMIVSLVHLPHAGPALRAAAAAGVAIRRVNPWERHLLRDFILTHFSRSWAEEADVAFSRAPVTCFGAWRGGQLVGFAAYECSRKCYFGPTGVDPAARGGGIGKALLFAALIGLREIGYTYAIIGDAGPVDFYRHVTGAQPIQIGDGRGVYTLSWDPALFDLVSETKP